MEEEWDKPEGEHQGEEVGHFELAVVCFAHSDHKAMMEKMREEGFNPVLLHEIDTERYLVPDRILQVLLQKDAACIAVPREERFGAEQFLEGWQEEQTERVEMISERIWPYFFVSGFIVLLAIGGFSFLDIGTISAVSYFLGIAIFAAILVIYACRLRGRRNVETEHESDDGRRGPQLEHDEGEGHD